jgi:hypothetical protein
MGERPKLEVLDDPLRATTAAGEEPPPKPAASKRAQVESEPSWELGEEPLQAVFGRVPKSLARRLEGAVYRLRGADSTVRQQQLLAALLWRHVDPEDESSLERLAGLVEEYQDAARPGRRRDC